MQTQWEHGFNGPTGMRYPVLFALLDRKGYADADWWRTFDDLRLMEISALEAMRTKN